MGDVTKAYCTGIDGLCQDRDSYFFVSLEGYPSLDHWDQSHTWRSKILITPFEPKPWNIRSSLVEPYGADKYPNDFPDPGDRGDTCRSGYPPFNGLDQLTAPAPGVDPATGRAHGGTPFLDAALSAVARAKLLTPAAPL